MTKALVKNGLKLKSLNINLIFSALLLSACGPQQISQKQILKKAPKAQKDLGYIVDLDDDMTLAAFLEMYPDAKVREIYKPHHIYELSYTTEKEIKDFFGDIEVSKNEFLNVKLAEEKPMFSLEALQTQHHRIQAEQDPMADFQDCQQILKDPIASVESSISGLRKRTVEGQVSATFSVSQSNAIATLLAVMAPAVSDLSGQSTKEKSISLTTDNMGLYTIALFAKVVKNGVTLCSQDNFEFVITGNAPLRELTPRLNELNETHLKLDAFTQLKEVKAQEAWAESKGEGQVIAIIDSGVNYNHPFLRQNILINKNEIAGNGIDDDDNGFVDDVMGYDFANDDNMPYDDGGHGSHVAGLAAGHVFGVAPKAKILPVKAMGPRNGDRGSIIKSVYYAVDNGATVINMSVGGYSRDVPADYQKVMEYAESKDVIVIAAAGNGHPATGQSINTDQIDHVPSTIDNDIILSVGASAKNEALTSYSNFGVRTVDVVAPGGSVSFQLPSAYYENTKEALFIGMQGTSMATPVTSGVVALMKAKNPTLKASQIKKIIMESGDYKRALEGKIKSSKQVSALSAVQQTPAAMNLASGF